MCQSIQDLSQNISNHKGNLIILYDDILKILEYLTKKYKIVRLGLNEDYTPFSKKRDTIISNFCHQNNIEFTSKEDITLLPIGSIKTENDTIYKKFTPFYHKCLLKKIQTPKLLLKYNFASLYEKGVDLGQFYESNVNLLHNGGRIAALKQLKRVPLDYKETRNIPSIGTTEMSAYNKFGCISIREFYFFLKKKKDIDIIRQLFFRDFYYNIGYFYPDLLAKGYSFEKKWDKIKWDIPNPKIINAFYQGKTGFPIIDAGIRQMLKTGFMHNRVRMLVASFFVKDLLYDWRIGEKFFANNLYDYDPIQNNSGWQTVAGVGASALEWFRVMNPWTQTEKYDPECKYIKRWVEELRDIGAEMILNWNKDWDEKIYYKPIVNHEKRRDIMLKRYKMT